MADEGRFPINIDFTDFLGSQGVHIPGAAISILSTRWDDSGKLDGKPEVEWPDDVRFWFGENETNRQTIFAHMLANFDAYKHERQWFYNQASFAMQARMMPKAHPFERILRQRKVSG